MDELIRNLNFKRRQKLHKKTENLNFSHSSHRAWSLMKKLGDSNQVMKRQHTLGPNSVAARLLNMGKLLLDKEHKRVIKTELRSRIYIYET